MPKRDGAAFLTSGGGDLAAASAAAVAAVAAAVGEEAKGEVTAAVVVDGLRDGEGTPILPLENIPFPMPNKLLSLSLSLGLLEVDVVLPGEP